MSIMNMNADKSATVVAFSASTLTRPKFKALPPLSLYVHIPWCLKKCPYCDFNSHEARDDVPESAYVAALLADLEFALPSIWGRKVISVFIGGGPGIATESMSLRMYYEAFTYARMGTASAIAMIIFAINLLLTLVYVRVLGTERYS